MIAIARDVNHPSALSNALGVACYMLTFHHDPPRMLRYAEEVKSFAREEGWELWYAVGVMSSGWARLRMGDRADGLRELLEGVALFRATRSDLMGPTVGVIHGEGLRAAGRQPEALEMLADYGRKGAIAVTSACFCPTSTGSWAKSNSKAVRSARQSWHFGRHWRRRKRRRHSRSRSVPPCRTIRSSNAQSAMLKDFRSIRQYYERFTDSFSQPDLVRARALLNGAAH